MSAKVEFEEKLAAVNATAKALRELTETTLETGFEAPEVLLSEMASKLAWACNYLAVAGTKLAGEEITKRNEWHEPFQLGGVSIVERPVKPLQDRL